MLAAALCQPLRFIITGGQVHGATQVSALLEGQTASADIADKAYDSNGFREQIAVMNVEAVIPSKRNRMNTRCLRRDPVRQTRPSGKPAGRGGKNAPANGTRWTTMPHGQWKTTTFVGGVRLTGIVAPLVLDGPTNGRSFQTHVDHVLIPDLHPGDIVIMDNLSSHQDPGVQDAIEAAGASVRDLPPYSPDFNPIEKAFSKLKAHLRRAAERIGDAQWDKIGTLIDGRNECERYEW